MIRRLPIVPTIIVACAVAVMISLGVWQLGRGKEKEVMLARYAQAEALPTPVPWPATAAEREQALYRQSALNCTEVLSVRETAGRSSAGESGWAHMARCRLPDGDEAEVGLGWSRNPEPPVWSGGEVAGIIGPAGDEVRLVASSAQAGLEPLAPPNPGDLPNNHMSYAMQWFFFAAAAVVIYALAVRRKLVKSYQTSGRY